MINVELMKLGAPEVEELLQIFEENKKKSFEDFCKMFSAEVEDINEVEGEDPWLEAYARYKHLSFCFCDDLEVRCITVSYKNEEEEIETNEFNYTGENLCIPVANERYYRNWIDIVKIM